MNFRVHGFVDGELSRLQHMKQLGQCADYRGLAEILPEITKHAFSSEKVCLALEVARNSIPVECPRYQSIEDWDIKTFGGGFEALLESGFIQYAWTCRTDENCLIELSHLYHHLVCYGAQSEDVTCSNLYRQLLIMLIINDTPGLIDGESFGICHQPALVSLGRKHPELYPLLQYFTIRLTCGLIWPNHEAFSEWRARTLFNLGIAI